MSEPFIEFVELEIPIRLDDLFLYMTNGDFASGQRWVPLIRQNLVIGRFSEGQERVV